MGGGDTGGAGGGMGGLPYIFGVGGTKIGGTGFGGVGTGFGWYTGVLGADG